MVGAACRECGGPWGTRRSAIPSRRWSGSFPDRRHLVSARGPASAVSCARCPPHRADGRWLRAASPAGGARRWAGSARSTRPRCGGRQRRQLRRRVEAGRSRCDDTVRTGPGRHRQWGHKYRRRLSVQRRCRRRLARSGTGQRDGNGSRSYGMTRSRQPSLRSSRPQRTSRQRRWSGCAQLGRRRRRAARGREKTDRRPRRHHHLRRPRRHPGQRRRGGARCAR